MRHATVQPTKLRRVKCCTERRRSALESSDFSSNDALCISKCVRFFILVSMNNADSVPSCEVPQIIAIVFTNEKGKFAQFLIVDKSLDT